MDTSEYTFMVRDCSRHLDKIETRLGVNFDRVALFGQEQSLEDSFIGGRVWNFKFSLDAANPVATFSLAGEGEFGVRKCVCGNHVEFTSSRMRYPSANALKCALSELKKRTSEIQALRQPQQGKQMTTQDKETIMHEAIARASLVAFAEFIGQPISDIEGVFQQARTLYGRANKSIACVVKIPVDKTKPIIALAVDGGSIHDGVKLEGDVVRVSYYLGGSTANNFRSCATAMTRFAPEALKILTAERAKQTPPPPAKPEPIPYESECRAHIKRLNKELGINLNEDAVLAAGEVARATPRQTGKDFKYILQIVKKTRAASFAVLPISAEIKASDNVAVFSIGFYPSEDGLVCGLRWMIERILRIQSELTPPAPSKPALTVDNLRPANAALEQALHNHKGSPIFVFDGKESTTATSDCQNFLALLTSGATNLFLTFQRKADRAHLTTLPRVHVHTSPTPLLPEFNTTISAPIDPTNPAATLTALAERITAENL